MKPIYKNVPETKLFLFVRKCYRPIKCVKCGIEVKKGDGYYSAISNPVQVKYCKKCVGLFMSRYSYTFQVPKPDEETLEWKSKYDNEIKDKTGINIAGFAFGE